MSENLNVFEIIINLCINKVKLLKIVHTHKYIKFYSHLTVVFVNFSCLIG